MNPVLPFESFVGVEQLVMTVITVVGVLFHFFLGPRG